MSERAATTLTGWGRTAPSVARLRRPESIEALQHLVSASGPRGTIARGLGRSYNDAPQNAGGEVLDLTNWTRILRFDRSRGLLRAEAGLSIDALLHEVVPAGWFVPVTAGTRFVTLGGAFAADIHGKNHHVDGSFAQHVRDVDMVLADGSLRRLSPDDEPALFWATAGGMGLTGVITQLELQLIPISTSLMQVDTERANDLDDVLDRLERDDHRYRYSVAWLDTSAGGRHHGRGVISRGWHAELSDLPTDAAGDPLRPHSIRALGLPDVFPSGLINRMSTRVFNSAWYHRAPSERHRDLQSMAAFFHPLDGLLDWNRIYGRRGLVQYQFAVPPAGTDVIRETLDMIGGARTSSFLSVLKRFGPGNDGLLSFPMEGWTLAVDLPVGPGLPGLLDDLDRKVLAAGGRLYLAKDARTSSETLAAGYPRLEAFRRVRAEVDPTGRFRSDLARRMDL